jgi:hypothetical protein
MWHDNIMISEVHIMENLLKCESYIHLITRLNLLSDAGLGRAHMNRIYNKEKKSNDGIISDII